MPDRITDAAGQVQTAAHDLVDEVKKERKTRRVMFTLLAVALFGLAAVVVDNRVDSTRERDKAEAELVQRFCAAWHNRIEDHALLTDFLAERVGSAEGDEFVAGLRKAYAISDAEYAKERGITEEECE
jgi:hypothetical protein